MKSDLKVIQIAGYLPRYFLKVKHFLFVTGVRVLSVPDVYLLFLSTVFRTLSRKSLHEGSQCVLLSVHDCCGGLISDDEFRVPP